MPKGRPVARKKHHKPTKKKKSRTAKDRLQLGKVKAMERKVKNATLLLERKSFSVIRSGNLIDVIHPNGKKRSFDLNKKLDVKRFFNLLT